MSRRVVITGTGLVSALGQDWSTVKRQLVGRQSAVRYMHEWQDYQGLEAKIAAPIDGFSMPEHFSRKQTRSMDVVAKYAVVAAENALRDAELLDDKPLLESGRVGVACGSSAGGTNATTLFGTSYAQKNFNQITPNAYMKMAPQSGLVNIAMALGIRGRLIPCDSACTSASQSIGFAYESILLGSQDVMIAGGAEELNPCQVAVFDNVYAASRQVDTPTKSPAPYDVNSPGLVMGEGAGMLVLEEYEHAKARGAAIQAELVSFSTNNDGYHITRPRTETMEIAVRQSLALAGLEAIDIDYISGHGTASYQADKAESLVTHNVFGELTPISTLKSYIGHSLGASAGLEAVVAIKMMQDKWFHPTLNLREPNPEFSPLAHIMGSGLSLDAEFCQMNNFAFGGINTSLIFKRI